MAITQLVLEGDLAAILVLFPDAEQDLMTGRILIHGSALDLATVAAALAPIGATIVGKETSS